MKNIFLFIFILLSGCVVNTNQKTLVELEQGELATKPQVITLRMNKYTPTPGRQLKEIFVSNFSVKSFRGKTLPSGARDGLTDELKAKTAPDYGFSNSGPYSANRNFSDLMLYLSGIRYAQQNLLYCSSSLTESTSNDLFRYMDDRVTPSQLQYLGLRDCEKAYLGLNPNTFDFDKDGIPDYLELRCGLNPKNGSDASLNPTGDGVNHLQKCKQNIPIDESANSDANKLFAYQYKVEVKQDGSRTITIGNIPVLRNGEQNFIAIYLTEVNPSTATQYLFTAYSLIKADPKVDPYEFDFWATSPATTFNQEISFP